MNTTESQEALAVWSDRDLQTLLSVHVPAMWDDSQRQHLIAALKTEFSEITEVVIEGPQVEVKCSYWSRRVEDQSDMFVIGYMAALEKGKE